MKILQPILALQLLFIPMAVYAQTESYVWKTDFLGRRTYRVTTDTVYVPKGSPTGSINFDKVLQLSNADGKKIDQRVMRAFSGLHYRQIGQSSTSLMTYMYTDKTGVIKEVSFNVRPEAMDAGVFTLTDFRNLNKQLKGLQLTVPEGLVNLPYNEFSDIINGEMPYVYDAAYEAAKCNPASPDYNPELCEQSKCDPLSPNYKPAADSTKPK
jgi:hypothetical protein